MHPVTFQLKRSHLCAVAMGRKLFQGTPGTEMSPDFDGVPDMTPARFDILYLINRKPGGVIGHSDLRRALGLCRATISKAIKRLVELGLLESGQLFRGDARRKEAWLTDEGRRRIRRALQLVFGGRKFMLHFREFARKYAGTQTSRRLRYRIHLELEAMWQKAIDLSRHLGDKAALVHYFRFESDSC